MSARVTKSMFVNPDARVRCPTPDCWGDLVLFPTGAVDLDGIPQFANATLCPLCMSSFDLEPDISDRDLYLQVAWMRANPGATVPDQVKVDPPANHHTDGPSASGATVPDQVNPAEPPAPAAA